MTCRPDHVMEEAHVHVRGRRQYPQARAEAVPLPEPDVDDVLTAIERSRQQLEQWKAETDPDSGERIW